MAAVSGVSLAEVGPEVLMAADRLRQEEVVIVPGRAAGIIAAHLPVVPLPTASVYPDEATVPPAEWAVRKYQAQLMAPRSAMAIG